ncbi:transposable element Tc3 transposase [Trichonephila clavipes]|uniref:Transposable element Tc3 transposase n=1 Tax=Trichonephila clavipes TaxID=2585209 RepID=A0A8X6SE70_TRICX|nr:transposable element Tc3 transposase [Trichonephila clavipes]
MAQRKHLDDFLRGRIIGRLECERTQLEVSEEHGITQSVISRLWQRFQDDGNACQMCSTYRNSLSPAINWSREHALWTPQQWSCVMFSDEPRFSLQSDSRRTLIWRAPGTRYHQENTIERHRYGGTGWLFWGGIILGSRTDLHVQSVTMTGHIYPDVILEQHVRLFWGAMGAEFLFMDDNARPHCANIVDECLQSEDITHMDWPAYSPDLNPIECVWDKLGRRIAARQPPPASLPELRRALLDEWCNIPQDQIDNLILSMPRRSFDQVSEFDRGRIVAYRDCGLCFREIGSLVGRNQTTVMRICDRWMQESTTDRRGRSHPPQCTTSREDKQIVRMAVTDRSVTSRTIAQHIESVTHHSVSGRSIRRRLQQSGLSAGRPLLGLPLTQNHRCLRHQWCDERRMCVAEWNEVVFTDESRICLQHQDGRIPVRRHRGERMLNSCVMHRHTGPAPGIMEWFGIRYHSRTPLVRIAGSLNSQRYISELFEPVVLLYLKGLATSIFQHDRA